MKVTVFTANEPRHTALLERVAAVADEVLAVQECRTLFPGEVDEFFPRSEVMGRYFAHVTAAERAVMGPPRFLPANVRSLPVRRGDLARLDVATIDDALHSDHHLVFGSSWIRGPLADALVERGAVNLHMGVSPFFRGSSCNFWALHDSRPDLVGATIHRLGAGLDSGPILFHAVPAASGGDAFTLGMHAVRAAQEALVESLVDGSLRELTPVSQDAARELRYARHADFSDDVAAAFLAATPTGEALDAALARRDLHAFVRPRVR